MRARMLGLGVAAAVVLGGCGPYIDEVNKEHQSRMEPKLGEFRAAAAVVGTAPSLSDDVSPPKKVNIVLASSYSAKGNAALLYAEDLSNFDELGLVYARLTYSDLVQKCSAALHTEHGPWDPTRAELTPYGASGSEMSRLYPLCENLEYLAVFRSLAFAKPHKGPDATTPAVVSDADAGAEAGTSTTVTGNVYSGGYVRGELLIIRVKDPALVGGVRFEAESSPTINGTPTDIGLEQDLRSRVLVALKASLKSVGNVSMNE